MQRYILFLCFLCGQVICQGEIATAKPSAQTPTNVEAVGSYVPHATYPYSETYPNPGGYENYLIPVGPVYPDVGTEEDSVIPVAPSVMQRTMKTLGKVSLFLLGGMAILLIGGIFTTAVCSLTPLCTISFAGFRNVNKETMRSYVTADGLSAAASFVQDAVGKYQRLQRAIKKN